MNPTRRNFLRGAGALMALPFLESLAAPLWAGDPPAKAGGHAAKSDGRPPLRLGIFTVTGGTVIESWRFKDAGPLAPQKMPSILRSLEFAKGDLLMLSGLAQTGKGTGTNGHTGCAYTHLTGASEVSNIKGKIKASISVDQAAAKAVGDQTYLPSLEMGHAGGELVFSYSDADTPLPYESNPRLIFDRMFRGRASAVPNWKRRATQGLQQSVAKSAQPDSMERSVIDLVLDEAKRLRLDLGGADQHRLDDYLAGVRSIEKRVGKIEDLKREQAADGAGGAKSAPAGLVMPRNLPAQGARWKNGDSERAGEYIELLADLMVLAFQTDTTRVCTLAAGDDEAMCQGVVTVGYEYHAHTLEHQGNGGGNSDPIAREGCRQIHAWYTTFFAAMIKKMKAIDEGGTSLLDNSMLLYTSYMADGGHGRSDFPVLLAGKAQGTLKTGRHIAYKKDTPMANLYLEMLNRMGVKGDEFGNNKTAPEAQYGGRLPDLV